MQQRKWNLKSLVSVIFIFKDESLSLSTNKFQPPRSQNKTPAASKIFSNFTTQFRFLLYHVVSALIKHFATIGRSQ